MNHNNMHMVVPYTKHLSESVKNICGKVGKKVSFRGGNTTKVLLMAPEEKDKITQKGTVMYRHTCERLEHMRICKDLWGEV